MHIAICAVGHIDPAPAAIGSAKHGVRREIGLEGLQHIAISGRQQGNRIAALQRRQIADNRLLALFRLQRDQALSGTELFRQAADPSIQFGIGDRTRAGKHQRRSLTMNGKSINERQSSRKPSFRAGAPAGCA